MASYSNNKTGQGLLIQFAKSPELGKVKTRMQPQLTQQQSLELHCDLVRWTAQTLLNFANALNPQPSAELWISGDRQHPLLQQCLQQGVNRVQVQHGEDLGQRMCHAMSYGLQHHPWVILVGSDCPAIDATYLNATLEQLTTNDMVLGPAEDGGYVLIAMRSTSAAILDPILGKFLAASVFDNIDWGSEKVFEQTLSQVAALSLTCGTLPVLADIDRWEDLIGSQLPFDVSYLLG